MVISKEEKRNLINLYKQHRKLEEEYLAEGNEILGYIESNVLLAMRDMWRILGVHINYNDLIKEVD